MQQLLQLMRYGKLNIATYFFLYFVKSWFTTFSLKIKNKFNFFLFRIKVQVITCYLHKFLRSFTILLMRFMHCLTWHTISMHLSLDHWCVIHGCHQCMRCHQECHIFTWIPEEPQQQQQINHRVHQHLALVQHPQPPALKDL